VQSLRKSDDIYRQRGLVQISDQRETMCYQAGKKRSNCLNMPSIIPRITLSVRHLLLLLLFFLHILLLKFARRFAASGVIIASVAEIDSIEYRDISSSRQRRVSTFTRMSRSLQCQDKQTGLENRRQSCSLPACSNVRWPLFVADRCQSRTR